MEIKRSFLMVLLTAVLALLGACENSADETDAKSGNQSSNGSSIQSENDDSSNTNKNTPEKSSDATDNTQQNDQQDSSDHKGGESKDSSGSGSDITESKKGEYLKKLNDTKNETNKMEPIDSTTYALKKVEDDRRAIWDRLLNEIYGVLKVQLTTEEMAQLRKEQRNWIKYRDATALKASQKFKGGTQEPLEYLAVLANLTEERCYTLVENYMK